MLCKGTWAADSAVTSELGATASLQWESVLHAQHCGLHKSCWLGATEHAKSRSCLQGYRYRHWHKQRHCRSRLAVMANMSRCRTEQQMQDHCCIIAFASEAHVSFASAKCVGMCTGRCSHVCLEKFVLVVFVLVSLDWPALDHCVKLTYDCLLRLAESLGMQILGIMSRFRLWNAYCPEWKKITRAAR